MKDLDFYKKYTLEMNCQATLNLSPEIIKAWEEASGITFDIITLEKGVDAESLLGDEKR